MIHNTLHLLLAMALLLPRLPLSPEFRRSFRRTNLSDPGGAVRVWQNWVDLIRAAAGVYLLMECDIWWLDHTQPGWEYKAFGVKAVLLGLVLVVQTVRVLRTVQFLAPVFYLCGLTLMLGGWPPLAGSFAVAVGWFFAVTGKNLAYQLPAMAFAAAVAGYFLGPFEPLMLNCVLIIFPLVLAAFCKKRLLFAASVPAS